MHRCILCGANDWALRTLRTVGFECQRCGVFYPTLDAAPGLARSAAEA